MISVPSCLYSPKPCIHDDISFYIICFFNQLCFIKTVFQPGQQGMCWATMSNNWSHWFHLPACRRSMSVWSQRSCLGICVWSCCVSQYITLPRLSAVGCVYSSLAIALENTLKLGLALFCLLSNTFQWGQVFPSWLKNHKCLLNVCGTLCLCWE